MATKAPPLPIPRVQVSSQLPYDLAARLEAWRVEKGHKSTSAAVKALIGEVLG